MPDALAHDVGMLDRERLHRDPAHRVTHHDDVAQVETLDHTAYVPPEVRDAVSRVAGERLAVPAVVEGDDAQAELGQLGELLDPDA